MGLYIFAWWLCLFARQGYRFDGCKYVFALINGNIFLPDRNIFLFHCNIIFLTGISSFVWQGFIFARLVIICFIGIYFRLMNIFFCLTGISFWWVRIITMFCSTLPFCLTRISFCFKEMLFCWPGIFVFNRSICWVSQSIVLLYWKIFFLKEIHFCLVQISFCLK